MALQEFVSELESLCTAANEAFSKAESGDQLEDGRVEFLGAKNGRLKSAQKLLGSVEKSDKPAAGQKLNQIKKAIQAAFEEAKSRLVNAVEDDLDETFDPTLPGAPIRMGRLHPITQTIEELKDIMGRLGFSIEEGPEIEDDWHNFEALNIPREHPARDPLDNFYLATANQNSGQPLLLRSQTSTVQIRVMENTPPPIRIISLGRVYRPDTADRTHYPMFHQMEGLMIDVDVTMADLKTVLRLFATNYLGEDVRIRIRPSFFPFTEPSVEADYYWNGKWVEFGGAGMVDPNVLQSVGYDPETVSGFAFGLGVERLCMRRHSITDIRDLFTNETRFLHQF
ncbi:phenylalanine--tRNA ligase subunit alpha [Mariniblastus sp.]|nr:phenylalanine--tRNA ligase subunit alpha [Mariniblastus sp.]MDB4755734.1 phenylalanine--tRNA ligase subunit alpha [Mariniblastus sp.]